GVVGMPMDKLRIACLVGLVNIGYSNKILLSHDSVNFWLGRPELLPDNIKNLTANWHMTHLFENLIPLLKEVGIADEHIKGMLEDNVRSVFGG
ncbi:MAG: phosphotriesterase-related protein, partial [Desulfotomaculales bacterium]